MGNVLASIYSAFFGNVEIKVIVAGLDGAGKTTLLYKLKLGEVISTIPTIGFNVETLEYNNISFLVWDFGFREMLRPLWRKYYEGTQALIFVVDSTDRERLYEVREELNIFLREDDLSNAILLVLANKQDLAEAMSVAEVSEALGLDAIANRKWHIEGSSSFASVEGLHAGLDWLSNVLSGAEVN